MRAKSTSPCILSTSIAAILGFATLGVQASAQSIGVFSNSGSLGLADQTANVGLSTTKTYRQAIDLGDPVDTLVNDVLFTGTGGSIAPSGTGWAITGLTNHFPAGGTLPGGTLGGLTNGFIYGGNPGTLTLSGLTVGQTYIITFYNRSWEGQGARVQNITASGASSATTVFDEDIGAAAQGELNLLRYTFQASSATQTLSISPQVAGNTMHLYAFTNEQTFNNNWTSGANWSTAQWSVGQPNGVGANANFRAQAAPTTINLDAARTVGHVQFDGTNAWTVSGANALTLQADVGGVSVLSALAGSHSISTPVVLASDVVKFGSGSISLTGAVSGSKSVTVNAGTLTLGAANSYTGGTTVNNGGTLRLGATGALGGADATLTVNAGGVMDLSGVAQGLGTLNGLGTIANNMTGTNAVLTIGGGHTSSNFAGTLTDRTTGTGTGTLGLTKTGAGTVVLTGTTNYSGPTTVSAGRLQLNGNAAAGTLATSAISVGTTGTFGFTAGTGSTLAMKTGSTLTLGGGTIALDLASTTTSDKITTDALALTANSAFSLTPIGGLNIGSTYTLVTYNTLSNPGNFTLTGTTAGRLSMIPTIGANAITLTPTLDSGTWNSASGGTWSSGPWTNYTPGAAGDSAVFGPALTANGTVTIDSPRAVGYLSINNGAASYTLGASGSSNLTLDNGTFVALVDVKAGSHTLAENVALASDVLVTSETGASLTTAGIISGTKALSKAGAGTLIVKNAQTYSGGTTILGGTLQLGDGTTNGSVTGNIVDNGTLAFNNGAAQTYAGVISGTGKVTKAGTGTLTLTGANTVTGGLTISAGTVDIGGNSTAGSITGPITNNATLRFSRTNASTIDSVITGTGNTIVSGGTGPATATTLAATASINTPTLTIGDTGTTQGWLKFGASNQLNGTTGVLLNITAHPSNSRIELNGFNQTVAGLTGTGIVQNVEVGTPGAATLTINVPGSNSYSWTGLIRNMAGGAISLTKTGTGEQVMNFSITNPEYSGATTVSEGRLVFGSTIAAPVWTTSGINVAAGAEVGLTGAGAGVVSWSEGVVISGAGNVVRTGADTNTVTIANATNTYTGYTKLSGTGTLAVSTLANIGVNSSIGRGDSTSAATNAASLVLDGGTLRYTGGAANSDRLFTLTQNGGVIQSDGIGAVNFTNSGALGTSGSGARTLTLGGINTGNNTLAAALGDGTGGATSLTKNGEGTWVLTGANTYTGATTVNAGRLQFEGSAANGTKATSNLAVNAGATFGFTAGSGSTLALANTFTLGGGAVVLDLGSAAGSDKITANTLALTANSTIQFNQIGNYDLGTTYTLATYNTLSNAGGFTVGGFSAGRLSLQPQLGPTALTMTPVLDNAVWNSATGGTWSAGPWTNYIPNAIGDAALFGSALTANGTVTLDTPKTVGYMSFNNTAASYTVGTAGSAKLTFANSGAAAAQVFVNAGNHTIAENATLSSDVVIFTPASTGLTISGVLDGVDRSVTKNGSGTLTLSGTNNFGLLPGTGLNINQGKVVLGSATALPFMAGVNLNSGGTLDLNGNDVIIGLAGNGGTVTDNATTAGTTTFTIDQSGNSVFGGVIADGATRKLAVVKNGTGSLTIGGANTFSGGFTIAGGSVITASASGAAIPGNITLGNGSGNSVFLISGAAAQQYGANTVLTFANAAQDAKFQLRGFNQTLAGIDSSTVQSLSIIQNDDTLAPGYTTPAGAATLTLNTATDHSFYGIIRNEAGGPLGITKDGPGTQELINRPDLVGFSYTGATTINGGKLVLNLSGASAAAFASDIVVNGSGTLGLDGFWTLGRRVTGTGSVVKQGEGIVTVASALTHTGNTTVAAGTLVLTGSLAATPTIDVKNGAFLDVSGVAGGFKLGAAQTLKGAGTVLGAATINGRLAPGDGLGTLLMDALTFGDGSVFDLEINTSTVAALIGASDLAAVNGSFSLSTGLAPTTLNIADLGGNVALAAGTKFTFITYAGTWNGGLFKVGGNTIADEGLFTFGPNTYRLDYNAGGNSVALIAVPEPSTGLVVATSLGALLGLRRRRKA